MKHRLVIKAVVRAFPPTYFHHVLKIKLNYFTSDIVVLAPAGIVSIKDKISRI